MIKFVKQWMCNHEFVVKHLYGIDNEFMRCNYSITCKKCGKSIRATSVTDGYHSFDELYEHRCLLFIALMKQMPDKAFWAHKNNKGEEWNGWIICAIETDHGQISYHVPERHIVLLSGIREKDRNNTYDGHTSDNVLERLKML